jgi:hypothetical protein
VGYVLIIAISVGVGIGVYRLTANLPVVEEGPEAWVGGGPAEQGGPCFAGAAPTPHQLRAPLDHP